MAGTPVRCLLSSSPPTFSGRAWGLCGGLCSRGSPPAGAIAVTTAAPRVLGECLGRSAGLG